MIALKTFRILLLIGIGISIYDIFTEGIQNIPIWIGGILALEIWMFIKIQKEINKINSSKRIVYLLGKILDKMKKQGVDDIRDLKDEDEEK